MLDSSSRITLFGYLLCGFPAFTSTLRPSATEIREIFPFDDFSDVKRVPALLIAGDEDKLLDGKAGTDGINHQAGCFASLLRSRGVHVRTLNLRGGHSAPVRRIVAGDDEVLSTINEFLSDLTGD